MLSIIVVQVGKYRSDIRSAVFETSSILCFPESRQYEKHQGYNNRDADKNLADSPYPNLSEHPNDHLKFGLTHSGGLPRNPIDCPQMNESLLGAVL